MSKFQQAKRVVREYFDAMERAAPDAVVSVLNDYVSEDYVWQGVYPFREQTGITAVANAFWTPLLQSMTRLQRRQDIFIAGNNEMNGEQWVMSMGHFMGLFDKDWLGIRATRKMVNIRYAEFNCVENGKITKTGLFIDLLGVMEQAGCYPLPPSTGRHFVYPGPRDHNGLLFDDAPEEQGAETLALVNQMVDDLSALNESGSMSCPPEVLEKSWCKDMVWYGPCGIGASYTIPRYQQQHQLPFRNNLKDKQFNGHVCRFAEGNFACFFGWPNLSNTPIGGFLGMPGGEIRADMQVVDVYYRKGDKLSENWVLIDIPYWLKQQGLDVFERTQQIMNP
ncbi:nuclear transport factor 2 family protein [Vibrio sp. S4M6]|uniref:nuclear transport factor 2 family protein n=1 Tax=Vibrio sinus TaxID=2946865 RepID=UPI002029F1B0|nr:nuclear transport factor 2 family protein [Vibrio sinus]MCL9780212.1 nuclear transport factor 2 family protein [Vibrio sinus]